MPMEEENLWQPVQGKGGGPGAPGSPFFPFLMTRPRKAKKKGWTLARAHSPYVKGHVRTPDGKWVPSKGEVSLGQKRIASKHAKTAKPGMREVERIGKKKRLSKYQR